MLTAIFPQGVSGKFLCALILSAAIFVLAACGGPKNFKSYQQAIGAFKNATDTTSIAAAKYILNVNKFDRARLFDQYRANVNHKAIDIKKIIKGRYSADAIEIRRRTFSVLNNYVNFLAEVANSDAPDRWASAAAALGTNAENLITTVNTKLTKNALKGSKLNLLVGANGPLSKLVTFAGIKFINLKRGQALDRAITSASPVINKIALLLRKDFQAVRDRRAILITDGLLGPLIKYRQAREKARSTPASQAKEAARLRHLTGLEAAISDYERQFGALDDIMSAIEKFDQAHAALVAYAKSKKGPKDLGELVAVIKSYAAVAKDISDAFKARSKAAGSAPAG